MKVDISLGKLIQSLLTHRNSRIVIGDCEVALSITDGGDRMVLTTPVYNGSNYLPLSVREAIQKKPPFSSSLIQTDFLVNEDRFEITLRNHGFTEDLKEDKLRAVLEEFTWLADEWRLHLDEHDRNDRVHIPTR